jgi:hypothetical protein
MLYADKSKRPMLASDETSLHLGCALISLSLSLSLSLPACLPAARVGVTSQHRPDAPVARSVI